MHVLLENLTLFSIEKSIPDCLFLNKNFTNSQPQRNVWRLYYTRDYVARVWLFLDLVRLESIQSMIPPGICRPIVCIRAREVRPSSKILLELVWCLSSYGICSPFSLWQLWRKRRDIFFLNNSASLHALTSLLVVRVRHPKQECGHCQERTRSGYATCMV